MAVAIGHTFPLLISRRIKREYKLIYIKIRMFERGDTVCGMNCTCCDDEEDHDYDVFEH